MLLLAGIVILPSDSMNSGDNNNDMMMMPIDMSSSSSDNIMHQDDVEMATQPSPNTVEGVDKNSMDNNMKNMIMDLHLKKIRPFF